MPSDTNRAIIIGGGIAGLSAAVGLRNAGVEATVFERAPQLGEVGTGVGLWLNGTQALRELGALEAVERGAAWIEDQKLRSLRKGTLVRIPIGELARKYDRPPAMLVRRPAIIDGLREALDERAVELDADFVGVEQDESGVTAHFADGRSESGGALIGADGIKSTVRQGLFPEVQPRYAGYQYLRGVASRDEALHPEGLLSFVFGKGHRFGFGDVGGGQIYWWAVVVTPKGTTDREEGRKQELLERFASFPDAVSAAIAATPEETILRNDIHDIEPMPAWGEGRVVLMGDAAHATTPNLGRGGGEAMEDAVVLARRLGSVDLDDGVAVAAALDSFADARQAATAKVQKAAWKIGKTLSWSDPIRTRGRDLIMKKVMGRALPKQAEADLARARTFT